MAFTWNVYDCTLTLTMLTMPTMPTLCYATFAMLFGLVVQKKICVLADLLCSTKDLYFSAKVIISFFFLFCVENFSFHILWLKLRTTDPFVVLGLLGTRMYCVQFRYT